MAATEKGLEVTFEGKSAPQKDTFDKVLVAVGRRPNGKAIGAEAAGVEVDEQGFIPVDREQRTNVHHIFAIGDVAIYPEALPQLAQPALQGGKHAGKQIAALVTGRPTHPFRYHDKGTMATVGRRAAIADIALVKGKTIKLTGTLAWLAWLFVHIVMLLGNRNRLATLVNLSTKYLAPSRRTNPIVGDVPVFEHQIPEAER